VTGLTLWRGLGRLRLPKISFYLVVVAGFAGNHYQIIKVSWRVYGHPNLPS